MKHFIDLGTHLFEGLEEFIKKLNIDNTFCVYCYEPNNIVYEKTQEQSKLYYTKFHKFNHFNVAVTDYNGIITFNCHSGAWKNNKNNDYLDDYDYGSNCLSINPSIDVVAGVTFDINSYNVNCVDINKIIEEIYTNDNSAEIYIKCDIEGSEFVVLPRLLTSPYVNLIKQIYIEWHERFWTDKNEFNKKIIEKTNIINEFNKLSIHCFVHG